MIWSPPYLKCLCWSRRERPMLLCLGSWATGKICYELAYTLDPVQIKKFRAAEFQLRVDPHLRSPDGKDSAIILASTHRLSRMLKKLKF